MCKLNRLCFCIFLSLCAAVSSISGSDDADCVYTAYIRTGTVWKGGTDSIISLTLYDADGYGVRINNLEAWGGLMGEGYDYFERGNLDIFSGRGPCLSSPICSMNLTSDGTGPHHGWYCNYVEVTVTGVHQACNQQLFTVEQWLATDASPYSLTAIVDNCYYDRSRLTAVDDCVYTAYVRTGSILKAGTDSIITLTLYDADGYGVRINDLEAWGGLMGEGYDYFERGNLDIFSGRGPCLSSPICSMNLTSDGSGKNHGWYCNYVEVTVTGVHQACSQQLFTVEQWLATDTSPYTLTAIVDNCYSVRSRLAAGDGEKISSQIIAEI
nr:PLAT domain-containing protein 3-like [Ipomoea batatas]GME02029.1 PLAT domain-containing protein 3-like [Ipomoea batatas]